MGKTFRNYDQDQTLLLPPSLDDWLPQDHLARFVSETIDALDLSPIFAYYEREERGYPPYHPSMMVKLLVYGYCVDERSSRRLERAVIDHVPFRFLAAGNQPKHSAIGEFRRIHLAVVQHLFVEVLRLAQRSGILKMGTVAIDGTKMKANASLRATKDHDALSDEEAELHRIVKAILDDAERIDQEEDALYGPDRRGDELPEGLRTKKERLERIRQAKEEIEREACARAKRQEELQREWDERYERVKRGEAKRVGRRPLPADPDPTSEDVRNTTDLDSRIMKNRHEGFLQGYNAQAAVDTKTGLMVACDVTNSANDKHQLNPMLDAVHETMGAYPKRAILDTGYWGEDVVQGAPKDVELFIATKKDRDQRQEQEPAPRGRIPSRLTLRERMERKLRTKRGRATYKLRGRTIEPRFGCIKEAQGVRGFLLRGIEKVRAEWRLIMMSHNVLRLWRLQAT